MLFLLPIRIGRYIFYIRMLRYGSRTHVVLRSPGLLKARLMCSRWLPILPPEHLSEMARAKSLGILVLPLPFRELHIEIYRHEPGVMAD